MSINNILITGGSGFLASHYLSNVDYSRCQVFSLERQREINCQKKYQIVEIDEEQLEIQVKNLINDKNIDVIIHLAGKINGSNLELYDANVALTKKLTSAAAASKRDIKFIFLSSVSALNICNYYGYTKRQAEVILEKIRSDNIKKIILRPSLIYGLNDKKNISTIFSQIKKFNLAIFPKTNVKFQPLYVGDLTAVIERIIQKSFLDLEDGVYTLAGPTQITLNEIIDEFEKLLMKKVLRIEISLWIALLGINLLQPFSKFLRLPVQQITGLRNHPPYDTKHASITFGFNPMSFKCGIKNFK